MKKPTLGQATQLLRIVRRAGISGFQLQDTVNSGLLDDVFKAKGIKDVDRYDFRRLLGYRQPPRLGQSFDLKIDSPFSGLEVVKRTGSIVINRWTFTGTEITESVSKRFMIVAIDFAPTFLDVKRQLIALGRIPKGQWQIPFMNMYPDQDPSGDPIHIADDSWVYHNDDGRPSRHFVSIFGRGSHGNLPRTCDGGFRGRWLVEVVA